MIASHALLINSNNHLSLPQNSADPPALMAITRLKDVSHVTKRDLPVQPTLTLIASVARKDTSSKVLDPVRVKIHDLQVTLVKILTSCEFRVIILVICECRKEKKDVLYVR